MGACLSCLGGENDDSDYNERTSLLGAHNGFSNEDLQEELIKQQQRQNELNTIVNDLSDHLIDISTFLSARPSAGLSYGNDNSLLNSNLANDETRASATSPNLAPAGLDDLLDRLYPRMWSLDEKRKLLKDVAASEVTFELEAPAQSLYVTF